MERVEPIGGSGSSLAAGGQGANRCVRLSRGQLEVLRLVNQHLNSKEIGSALGISSHTVDQRIRGAIRTLGVARRSEAARLVDAYDRSIATSNLEATETPAYQRLKHQSPDIDAATDRSQIDGAISYQIRHADRTEGAGAYRLETEQRSMRDRPSLVLPWSTPHQPRNGWSVGQRLVTIAGIAIAASFSAGMFLAGLESLSRLVRP
ncbi:helix-turn-helix transcriptional regulator [Sphingomonas sp. LHG3406-1]|uniref:helix-turn-helix domain-containing protein n=1 Tax=Sphingomonas sp. LHG3406-1 TaxID=2804617 RepID=UPI002603E1D3|nr:helix-turn-helix transcriptional regulator [Sphingomonas sp. LHG3406-1]